MSEKQISPFNPTSKKEFFFLCVIFIYIGFHGYVNHMYSPSEYEIGYTDHVARSYPLDGWLQGKVFFKDFFFYYGPLFAFLQLPFYYLFGANHWALMVNMHIIIPPLSIFLAHLYIRIFVKVPLLRISFVLVCLFHLTVGMYQDLRHLPAELTLALFFFCLTRPDGRIWLFFTGIMQGISILMDPSYGAALLIVICATFILFSISNTNAHVKIVAKFFLFGLLVSLAPFISYMVYHGALFGYVKDYYLYATSYVSTGPPGRDAMFPPFPRISFTNLSESLNHLLLSQAFRQYLPIILYGAAGLVFLASFCRGKNPASLKFFLLSSYGFLIFPRSWLLPAYGYMAYGFIPAITIGFLFLEKIWLRAVPHYKNYNHETGYNLKNLLGFTIYSTTLLFVFTWLFLTLERKDLFTFNPETKSADMVYYKKVGFEISKEAYDQYTLINNYIEQNVRPDEYILTYPWGYYSQFTGRTDALTAYDAAYGVATERQAKYALNELNERRPRFVILNTYNSNGSVVIGKIRGDVAGQISWRTEDTPVFAGNGSPVVLYILENYHMHKKFKYATILIRNKKKRPFNRTFKTTKINTANVKKIRLWADSHTRKNISTYTEIKPATGSIPFEIKNRKLRIEYVLKEPQYATHIELNFLIYQKPYKKFLTKSRLRLGTIDSKIENVLIGCCTKGEKVIRSETTLGGPNINDMTDLNQIKTKLEGVCVPNKENFKKISSVWIELETPKPYLLPEELRVISLKLMFDERIKLD